MLNDRQSGIFNKLDLSKNPNQSKLSFVDQEKSSDPKMLYRSQAKSSVWFTLGSENDRNRVL